MKKLYITFTLILSSFFLFNYNVKADVINHNITDYNGRFESDSYLSKRESVINYAKEHDYYYIIRYRRSVRDYLIYFFNDIGNIYLIPDSNYILKSSEYLDPIETYYNNLSSKNSGGWYITFGADNVTYGDHLFDSNYPKFYLNNPDGAVFNYGSCSFSIKDGERVRSLYDYYLASKNDCILSSDVEEDIHKQEKEVLSNFYLLIFEKIDLLANSILSNYIYLTIIVIFILIFLIELIRRYLL